MSKKQQQEKQLVAAKAMQHIKSIDILGIGTGSTVECFIDQLAGKHHHLEAIVSSSKRTTEKLKKHGIQVTDANNVSYLDLYIDGADQYTAHGSLLKGGGGAHTGEKILAQMAKSFICIADSSKQATVLGGDVAVTVEVIPMARSAVARAIVNIGGSPVYRPGFITDHGNCILDILNLDLVDPIATEKNLNNIPGIVCNGIFALRGADNIITADE
jgi:ribose 5-phosphate isomerase A